MMVGFAGVGMSIVNLTYSLHSETVPSAATVRTRA